MQSITSRPAGDRTMGVMHALARMLFGAMLLGLIAAEAVAVVPPQLRPQPAAAPEPSRDLRRLLAAKQAMADSALQGSWDSRFGPPGPNGEVFAVARLGSDLYVGGEFSQVGNVQARNIARWDGRRWYSVGEGEENGVSRIVTSLLADGDSLLVGGQFDQAGSIAANSIAVWRPASRSWGTLGSGVTGDGDAVVTSMTKIGADLYVAGRFGIAAASLANNIARWSGGRWDRLKSGVNGTVTAMAAIGERLYVGGLFSSAGDAPTRNIALWDRTTQSWLTVGTGVDSLVGAIAVYGNQIFVGGHFGEAGGKSVKNLAIWNEASREWSAFPMPVSNPPYIGYDPAFVYALAVDGDNLYIGGALRMGVEKTYDFDDSVRGIFRWNIRQGTFHRVGGSVISYDYLVNAAVNDLKIVDGTLYVGGRFPLADRYEALNVAAYRIAEDRWLALGSSINGQTGRVYIEGKPRVRDRFGLRTFAVAGTDVYMGGYFSSAGGLGAMNIVRWNGTEWTPLGGGVGSVPRTRDEFIRPDHVSSIALMGSDVIAGGRFTVAGGVRVAHLARWNGSTWAPVGDPNGSPFNEVDAVAMIRGSLHVLGRAGGGALLARVDGNTFQELGRFDSTARTMAILGDDLYVGGDFTRAGGVPVHYLARLNTLSGTWSDVDGGTDGHVWALLAHDGKLYAGGEFRRIAGMEASVIAVLNGGAWSPLGSGLGLGGTEPTEGSVRSLAMHEGLLYAGGSFGQFSGAPANYLAAWSGERWLPVDEGTDQRVDAFATYGEHLLIGGNFTAAGSTASYYLAMWNPGVPTASVIAGRGSRDAGRSRIAAVLPNPASSAVRFQLELVRPTAVDLAIYDPLGRRVATVAAGEYEPGTRIIGWDAIGLPAGTYVCRMTSADGVMSVPLSVSR